MLPKTLFIVVGLSGAMLLLSGCNPKSADQEHGQHSASNSSSVEQQIAQNIRPFAATEQDAHDIALLKNYNDKFQTMSIEFEKDLVRLKQDGYLTADMEKDRRRDQALSAMNMLKALELETEQGRYIQGLYYQHWEKQYQRDQANTASAELTTPSELNMAEAQLKQWQSTQS